MTGWQGRFYEDFTVGDVYRSRLGRTVTETDNIWFTCLTLNTNQVALQHAVRRADAVRQAARQQRASRSRSSPGLSVTDITENAMANLAWDDIKLPSPVFAGDTLWGESEILELRESTSRPYVGIVSIRSRGINQRARS